MDVHSSRCQDPASDADAGPNTGLMAQSHRSCFDMINTYGGSGERSRTLKLKCADGPLNMCKANVRFTLNYSTIPILPLYCSTGSTSIQRNRTLVAWQGLLLLFCATGAICLHDNIFFISLRNIFLAKNKIFFFFRNIHVTLPTRGIR